MGGGTRYRFNKIISLGLEAKYVMVKEVHGFAATLGLMFTI